MKKILFSLLFLLIPVASFAFNPISVDKAFELSLKPADNHSFIAQWKIAPGYHLYRDRIHFDVINPSSAQIGTINFPTGISKQDDILGKYQIYQNNLMITVPMANAPTQPMTLSVSYQGCADSGFCYPPVTKQVTLNLGNTGDSTNGVSNTSETNSSISSSASEQDRITQLLVNQNWFLILLAFLGFGVLLAFTPCILPMIPILSGIIVGEGKNINGMKAFWLSLTYVLAMAVTYACAGVAAGLAGSYVQAFLESPLVLAIFSGVFVLLAFSLFGFYEIKMPDFLQNRMTTLSNKQAGGSYIGVAAMGCLSTLIVSPCVTAPLIGALSYIGKTGNAVLGGSALFSMGIGMGIPLLIIGTIGGKFLPKAGMWMDAVKTFFGVLMLGVAILLLSRVIPGAITMLLWAALLIMSAVYMGAFTTAPATGTGKLWKGFSVMVLVYGFLLLIGAGMGNADPLEPLALKQQTTAVASNPTTPFKKIKSLTDLRTALVQAKAQGKLVVLDFYADWCLSCKEMDRNTFRDPQVQSSLNQFVLLRADVTANDDSDKSLEKKLNVIAPPSILFFQNGKELSSHRIVGAVGAKEFSQHLQKVLG